jgi:hypothetical protein
MPFAAGCSGNYRNRVECKPYRLRRRTFGVLESISGDAIKYGKQPVPTKHRDGLTEKGLFIPLLMTVLSQSFLKLVRRDLMTLPFFTTRHTQIIF